MPDATTRRRYLAAGGAVVAGAFAGCTGSEASDSTTPATTDIHSATMAPMGTVEFDAVPERIFTRLTHLAGMAFALGRGNDVNAMHAPDYYDALWNQFTPRLDGVSLDWSGLYSSWNPRKEKLYELDSDVHLADPAGMAALDGWQSSDIEEIATNVAPWFGNYYSARHGDPPADWADRYRYYGLWEMFEKVSQVFQAQERYAALAEIHDELLATIADRLPPADAHPSAVMALPRDFDTIYAYKVNNPGYLTAHTRPFGLTEAFPDISSGDTVDMEAMLEADPDVLLGLGGMHPDTDLPAARERLRTHPVGSQLSAVENERVYAQGARFQGPILNLFQLEMTAKQLFPEQFGAWPTYIDGPYPELPAEEQLFDRERVASTIRGEV